jgi:hypothetical protein
METAGHLFLMSPPAGQRNIDAYDNSFTVIFSRLNK